VKLSFSTGNLQCQAPLLGRFSPLTHRVWRWFSRKQTLIEPSQEAISGQEPTLKALEKLDGTFSS